MNQQQVDVAMWVICGLISVLGTAMWWSIRAWIKGVNHEIVQMREELRTVGNKNVGFEKDIDRLNRNFDSHDKRLSDHSERIRNAEHKQAKCRNCNV